MTTVEFVKLVNDMRRNNKDRWVQTVQTVNGEPVRYKAYNTWIQILELKDFRTGNPHDQKVREYKAWLQEFLDRHLL